MAIIAISTLVLLTLSGSRAGSLSDTFASTFGGNGEKKDAIFEFSPVIQSVLSDPSLNSLSGDDRKSQIVSLLQMQTKVMQLPVMNGLASMGLAGQATPFWVANKIAVSDVPVSSLKVLSAIPGPFTLREAQTASVFPVVENGPITQADARVKRQTEYQWGVKNIGAPEAFAAGITGEGVVLGVIDTGARLSHEALVGGYRGGAYSWKDAVNNKTEPYDDNGHGTHCMGTAVGRANGVGVAPGAQWIACKALDADGSGTEKALTACGQFMACPNNSTGTCADYPNVVSNSWGGGNNNGFYNSIIQSWRALEIVPVFAIGNAGQLGCGSANSPGDQADLISVGSIDKENKLSSFSSRGPGGNVLERLFGVGPKKPEVVAPGSDITSADYKSDNGYRSLSGTSMATPHVAGAVALLLSQEKMGYKEVIKRFESTAVVTNAQRCKGLFDGNKVPNNEFGYGRVTLVKALKLN